jgi:hypothetical protein
MNMIHKRHYALKQCRPVKKKKEHAYVPKTCYYFNELMLNTLHISVPKVK